MRGQISSNSILVPSKSNSFDGFQFHQIPLCEPNASLVYGMHEQARWLFDILLPNVCPLLHAGATNKPQELDDAVLRRLVSKLVH